MSEDNPFSSGASNIGTILLLGKPTSGKHVVGKLLVESQETFKFNVHTSCTLPLPTEEKQSFNLVVLMVHLEDKDSIDLIEKSLTRLDVDYFSGRVCILVTNGGKQGISADIEPVANIAYKYACPFFTVDLQNADNCNGVIQQLLNMLEIAAGFRPNMNSLLIDSTRRPYQMRLDFEYD